MECAGILHKKRSPLQATELRDDFGVVFLQETLVQANYYIGLKGYKTCPTLYTGQN